MVNIQDKVDKAHYYLNQIHPKQVYLEEYYIKLSCKNAKQIDFIGINEDTGSLIFYRNQKGKIYIFFVIICKNFLQTHISL